MRRLVGSLADYVLYSGRSSHEDSCWKRQMADYVLDQPNPTPDDLEAIIVSPCTCEHDPMARARELDANRRVAAGAIAAFVFVALAVAIAWMVA